MQRIMPCHLLTPGKDPEINVEDDTPILIAFLDWRAYERDGEVNEHGGYVCRVSRRSGWPQTRRLQARRQQYWC